jgi:predicted alpha-1,2-mannosidase
VEYYIKSGYVPYPLSSKQYGFHQDGAGMTLEYSYQDWCLAQLSKALNKTDDYNYFLKRSSNYQNIFNPSTGYIQPKDSLGKWKEPFDPLQYDNGFIEGNAAHYTWFVPHDLAGLFKLMGGSDKAIQKLNEEFELSKAHRFCNEHPEKNPKFVDDKRTWINYSNQPNSQAAFIFNYAGAPWLTQYWSREVVNQAFSALTPEQGYNGDEDQGLMGSLSVLMKIGLFQMTGGVEEDPYYEIGSPLFDAVTIHLNQKYYPGSTIQIAATNNSDGNRYIQSAMIDGKPLTSFRVRHSELIKGTKLIFEMGPVPNKSWGIE